MRAKSSMRSSFLKEVLKKSFKTQCCITFSLAKSRQRRLVIWSLKMNRHTAYRQANTDIMLDGPPVYTSKEALSILTVNLGNFVRGRKKTVPEKFAAHVDRKDYNL